MQDVRAIGKNQKNAAQGFMFRGIDDFMNVLHPLFAQHGIFVTSEHLDSEPQSLHATKNGGSQFKTLMRIRFTFYALDGSSVDSIIQSEAMDAGDKGCNKALAVALKYVLMQTFLIPTEDFLDPDAEAPQVAEKKALVKPAADTSEQERVASMLKKPLPKASSPSAKLNFKQQIEKATSTQDLMKIWNSLEDMHANPEFKEAMMARKEEINRLIQIN